jgi:hypothetical protein
MKFAATVPTNSAGCKKLTPINAVSRNPTGSRAAKAGGSSPRAATFESTKIGACAVPAISDSLQRVRLKISPTTPL